MADMGVSQAELVEHRGDSGRKLPQYLAALAGIYYFASVSFYALQWAKASPTSFKILFFVKPVHITKPTLLATLR